MIPVLCREVSLTAQLRSITDASAVLRLFQLCGGTRSMPFALL